MQDTPRYCKAQLAQAMFLATGLVWGGLQAPQKVSQAPWKEEMSCIISSWSIWC